MYQYQVQPHQEAQRTGPLERAARELEAHGMPRGDFEEICRNDVGLRTLLEQGVSVKDALLLAAALQRAKREEQPAVQPPRRPPVVRSVSAPVSPAPDYYTMSDEDFERALERYNAAFKG